MCHMNSWYLLNNKMGHACIMRPRIKINHVSATSFNKNFGERYLGNVTLLIYKCQVYLDEKLNFTEFK